LRQIVQLWVVFVAVREHAGNGIVCCSVKEKMTAFIEGLCRENSILNPGQRFLGFACVIFCKLSNDEQLLEFFHFHIVILPAT